MATRGIRLIGDWALRNLAGALGVYALTGVTAALSASGVAPSDGRANAPAGTPQFASLLSGYNPARRPPWFVAGVDYAVGLKSNCTINTTTHVITFTGGQENPVNGQRVTLRTANGGTLPSGVSLDTAYVILNASVATCQIATTAAPTVPINLGGSPNLVVVLRVPVMGTNCMPPGVSFPSGQTASGNSFIQVFPSGASNSTNGNRSATGTINLDSYDFSFDGGLSVYCNTFGSGIINITNGYFRMGANLQPFIFSDSGNTATNTVNLSYCEFDGNGPNFIGVLLRVLQHHLYLVSGGTYKYCWFHHNNCIFMSPSSRFTMQYNLLNNFNYGDQATHMDIVFPNINAQWSNTIQEYNTFYQPPADSFIGGLGRPGDCDTSLCLFIQPMVGSSAPVLNNIICRNNTIVGLGRNHMWLNGAANGGAFNMGWYIDPKTGNTVSNMQIVDNYVDSSGIDLTGMVIFDEHVAAGGSVTGLVIARNKSMTTGNDILLNVQGTQ